MLCTHPREAQRAEICLRHFGGYAGDITLTILESSALGGVKRRGSRLEPAPPSVGRSVRRPQLAPRAGAVSFGWFIFCGGAWCVISNRSRTDQHVFCRGDPRPAKVAPIAVSGFLLAGQADRGSNLSALFFQTEMRRGDWYGKMVQRPKRLRLHST